jgi:tetratricopeptide (TPR) repeat protein
MAAIAQAASIEEARRLYQKGEQLAAQEELLEILALESDGAVRAQALDLLGMIAVDKGDLELAADVWEKLISDYPDSPQATEARTKLSLATGLNEVRAAEPAERASAPVETERSVPASPPVAVEAPSDQVVSKPADEAETAEPVTPADPKPPSARSDLVLVAGRGKPHDGAQRAAVVVIEHLQSRGVATESATKGVPVVEKSALVIPALLRQLEDEAGHSLLLVTSNFTGAEKIVVECYSPEGLLVWKKKVTGGTGWKGRPYSATGMNETLIERLLEKLDGQVGGPCLPVSD